MTNKNKQLPLFYKIYWISLGVFFILSVCILIFLNSFISEYNEGIPETVSEKFFHDTFLNLDTDRIIEMSGISHSEFETTEDLQNFLSNTLSKDLSYTSISSNENEKKYIVKSGEYKCASFSLVSDENGDYYPVSLSLHLPKENEYEYKILNTSTLYINGTKADNKYVTATEKHQSYDFLPDNTKKPEWNIYTISNLTKVPEAKVIDRNGKETDFILNDGVYTESIIYDDDEKEIIDRITEGAKKYAICMQDDAPKSSVYPYFEKGTDLYNSIRSVENMFVWEHSGYSIEDEKVSEFFRYDENTVSLRVAFTHVLKKAGREDYRDITDITYYARNIDGKYMIFARHNNA